MIYWLNILKVIGMVLAFGLFAGFMAWLINKADQVKEDKKEIEELKK